MRRYVSPRRFVVTIKNKWTNSSRVVSVSKFSDVQLAHKFAYYNYTNNLEDIVLITDQHKNIHFSIKAGFKRR
jgi:hypothetical protein